MAARTYNQIKTMTGVLCRFLYDAVDKGEEFNRNQVSYITDMLFKEGADPNFLYDGNAAIHIAADLMRKDIMTSLTQFFKGNPLVKNHDNLDAFDIILSKKLNVSNDTRTPKERAKQRKRHRTTIQAMLLTIDQPNDERGDSNSYMHLCGSYGSVDNMARFVQRNGNLYKKNREGHTVAFKANLRPEHSPEEKKEKTEVIQYILDQIKYPNLAWNENQDNYLHLCGLYGSKQQLKRFLNKDNVGSSNNLGHALLFNIIMRNTETPEEKQEQLEMAKMALEAGADPNAAILGLDEKNKIEDRGETLMHACAHVNNPKLMALMVDFKGDINKENIYGRKPFRLAISGPDKCEDLKRVMLEKGSDIFKPDKFGNSDFSRMDVNDDGDLILDALFPSAKGWTPAQRKTKIELLLLADYFGMDIKHYLEDYPPPDVTVEAFTKRNEITDRQGKPVRQRRSSEMLYNIDDMFSHNVRTITEAPLQNKYHLTSGLLNMKNYSASGYGLLYGDHEFPDRQIMLTWRAKKFANRLVKSIQDSKAWHSLTSKQNPEIWHKRHAQPLLTVMAWHKQWLKNLYAINEKINKLPLITWGSLVKEPVQTEEGLWIKPITSNTELNEEANTLKNCLGGFTRACIFDNIHMYSIRTNPDEPEYVFHFFMEDGEIVQGSDPMGFKDNEAPEHVVKAAEKFRNDLNEGKYGNLKEMNVLYMEGLEKIKEEYKNEIILETMYDPSGEDGMQNAEKALEITSNKMGSNWPLYKMNLKEMLNKFKIYGLFEEMMDVFLLDPDKYKTSKPALQ